jgi:hypothetical protein
VMFAWHHYELVAIALQVVLLPILILALPEKLGLGWLVNPAACMAAALDGPSVAFLAVALLILSPAFLSQAVVLILQSLSPIFFGEDLNLNGPDWRSAKVFYAIDPGDEQRTVWAQKLGYDKFVVIGFDPSRGFAELK